MFIAIVRWLGKVVDAYFREDESGLGPNMKIIQFSSAYSHTLFTVINFEAICLTVTRVFCTCLYSSASFFGLSLHMMGTHAKK